MKQIIAASDLFPPDMLQDMTRNYFNGNPDQEIWLTTATSQALGIVYCKPEFFTQGTANMLLLAVAGHKRRSGVGTALLKALESQLRKAGFHLLMVETSTQELFEPARTFYLRNGFSALATINDFYTRGEGKIIYTKYL